MNGGRLRERERERERETDEWCVMIFTAAPPLPLSSTERVPTPYHLDWGSQMQIKSTLFLFNNSSFAFLCYSFCFRSSMTTSVSEEDTFISAVVSRGGVQCFTKT